MERAEYFDYNGCLFTADLSNFGLGRFSVLRNRPVHALSCIIGNQGKIGGNSKVCMGFQSQLIPPELIYLTLSL